MDVYEFDVAIEGSEAAATVVSATDATDYDFNALVLSHEVYPLEADLQDLPLSVLGDALSSMGFSSDNKADNVNPKQEIITAGAGSFEYSQPLFPASMSHGYAVGPSDHQLFLQAAELDLPHARSSQGDRGVPSCQLAVSRGDAYIPSTEVLATPRGEPSLEGYHVSLTESNTDAFRHLYSCT
jgi:hypothetical protein